MAVKITHPGSSLKKTLAAGDKLAAGKKPTAPKMPTLADWLSSDPTYLDTSNSINTSLKNSLADNNQQLGNYDTTFQNDMRTLGYQGGQIGANGYSGGTWNMHDPLTQSGKAYSSQAADFASRGMIGSGGFTTAQTNLGRALNNQVDTANLSRQNYDQGLAALGANQQQQATDALTQAKREAIARRSNRYATSATGVLN